MSFQKPEEKYSLLSAIVSTAIIAYDATLAFLPAVATVAGISIATYLVIIIGRYLIDLALHIKNVVTNFDKTIESVNARVIESKVTLNEVNEVISEMKKTVSTLTPEVKNTLGHVNDTVDGMNPVNLTSRAVGAAGSGLSNFGHTLLSYLPFYGRSTTQTVAPVAPTVVPRVPRSKQPKIK
ncbi:MAG: hypothetical protein HYX61_02345 [Gammaproteobacteria bacterium]|jgi:hypothetical protein|nr:hypothetical protein [Gammaproteobacteria bacterium]